MNIHPAPDTITDLRQLALQAQLYCVAGTDQDDHIALYLGETGQLDGRAAVSFTKWVRTLRKINASALILIDNEQNASWAFRRYVEAETVRRFTQRAQVYNSQCGCPTARTMLGRADRLAGLDLADAITEAITTHVFHGQTITPPVHSGNNLQAYVRLIRAADRALDTRDVLERALAAGVPIRGATPEQTIRRDCHLREAADGVPRIYTCVYNGTRLYYSPLHTKRDAIAKYRAYRRRTQRPAA